MNEDVVAIVVAYNSDLVRLTESLSILAKQCRIVLVDNSTQLSFQEKIQAACDRANVFYLALGDNFGIARAQNIGIAWAREHAAVDILLMDDDSIPSQSLVKDLLELRKLLQLNSVVISARTVGENGEDVSNRALNNSVEFTSCSELTSSGSLIPIKIFDRVGIFEDRLFIDCVDFEWGWRALALDVQLILCNHVAIRHRLGEGSRFILRMPSPIRHYYQYRNILTMVAFSKAPYRWRVIQLIKLPIKLILILLLADRRFNRVCYAAWGICDFFTGRTGKFNR